MSRRPGLLDSAVILAVVGGALYFVGGVHVASFYDRLGVADTQLLFDAPFIMSQSFLPLLHPLVFLALAAFALSGIPPRQPQHDAWKPFYPVPVSDVVGVVLVAWAVKTFADHQYPSVGIEWLGWDRRDVLFFLAGMAILAALYVHHSRRALNKKPVISIQTTASAWIIGIPVLVVVLEVFLRGGWTLSGWRTALLVVGVAWFGWQLGRDVRKGRERNADQEPEADRLAWGVSRNRASTLMVYTVSTMALILAASLHGSLEARDALEGCKSVKTVAFDPPLDETERNRTYWLVLHHDGIYYLRACRPTAAT